MSLDLQRIEYLGLIADSGSFSKAAAIVGIAQPALGRHIRKLEEDCGVALLYRNGRGASLTAEGASLLESARPLIQQLETAIADLRSEAKSPQGAVSIGMTPALSRFIGLGLVTAVMQRLPDVRINVVTAYSGYLLEWLTNGRIDVGVLDNARRADHLVFDELGELRLSLVSPAAPASVNGSEIDILAIEGVPLVLPSRNHGLRRTVEQAAASAGIELNVAYEIDAHEIVRELVLNGHASTIMGAPAVQSEIDSGRLVARPIAPMMRTRLLCGTSANRPVTAAARAVVRLLKSLVVERGLARAD